MKNEAALTHEIVKALNQIPGVWCWRRNVGRRGNVQFGKPGMADIEGVLRGGRRLELEVKIEAKVTIEQSRWLEQMLNYGALAGVVRSTWDAVELVEQALR